jgi:hypothetical protein
MGLRQNFRFSYPDERAVQVFLRTFAHSAQIEDRGSFFVFRQLPGQPAFDADFEVTDFGLRSERAGAYFEFLGRFVEALTGEFGSVVVEDA